jgi:hypothetical protein
VVVLKAVPLRLVGNISGSGGVYDHKVLVSLSHVSVAILGPHVVLSGCLQVITFVRYRLSEFFSVGLVSDTLEELDSLLSF